MALLPMPTTAQTTTTPTIDPPAPAQYTPVTQNVSTQSTVQGQLNNILNSNNPLMRSAKAQALDHMNQRGLLNSSLAATAGYKAMIDSALPIAQQDAQAYERQAMANQNFENQAALTNTNWNNKLLENSYVTNLDFWKQANLQAQGQQNTLDRMGYDAQLRKDLLTTEYGLKKDLNAANLHADLTKQYLTTYKDMLQQLDAVLVDPNTSAAAKRNIVNNFVTTTNRMRQSIAALGTPIPNFDFNSYYV